MAFFCFSLSGSLPPQQTREYGILLQRWASLHIFFSLSGKSGLTAAEHSSAVQLRHTRDKCHADAGQPVGGGDHTWRLHILHIQTLLQAFVLTCCAHPVRAAEMIREHAGGSPRSCCLSGESKKTGKCERVLSRSKKSRKVTASLARTGMEEKTQFVS